MRQSSFSALTLPIRSFEELHNERSYLLASLTAQGAKSLSLMRRLLTIEDSLGLELTSDQRRMASEQAGSLKNKITEAAEQERAILTRLSELYVNILTQERWLQVRQQRYSAEMHLRRSLVAIMETGITLMTPTWSCTSAPPNTVRTPLSATSAEFVPQSHQLSEHNLWLARRTSACWPCATERELAHAESEPRPQYEFEDLEPRKELLVSGRHRSVSLDTAYVPSSREKRMSLPSLRPDWPEAEEGG
jgi:hypothetical protein